MTIGRVVPLKGGGQTIVDRVDYERVIAHQWRASSNGRGNTYIRMCRGGSPIYLHRFITDAARGVMVDHVNGDGRDNRRANLRPATHAQNAANQHAPSRGTSRYRGVHWNAARGKWHAQIGGGGGKTYIGLYDTEREAAAAYNEAAGARFGQFANPNDLEVAS